MKYIMNGTKKMNDETQLSNAYKRYNRVWEIERDESSTRYGKSLLWDLHMLKDMTEDEFIEEVKTNDEFAKKWGKIDE